MKQPDPMDIARRLAALPTEKRREFRARLAAQGIDAWRLPIAAQPAAEPARYPLSQAQRRFLAAEELSGRALYNLCSVLRFHGELDLAALERAAAQVIRRHEILRTRYIAGGDGEARQEVLPEWAPALAAQPASMDGDSAAWCRAEYRRQLAQRFDLEGEPPLRIRLFDTGDGDHWLFFTIHHIAFDAWSAQQLNREVAECYRAELAGEPPRLEELPVQYRDYALWQREWMESDDYRSQCEHWRGVLSDAPEALNLPLDRPRPPVADRRFSGGNLSRPLDPILSERIRRAAKDAGATLYIYGQTAFAWLLARYSGDRDLCLGTSIANRGRPELAPLIGPLLNTLVLRHDLDGDPEFGASLRRTREVTAAAFDHPDVPFEQLPALIGRAAGGDTEPLFRAMFVQLSLPESRSFQLPGAEVEIVEPEQQHARFDLTLRLVELADGCLRLDLEYSDELFERSTAGQMLAHLQQLFEQVLGNPGLRLSQLRWTDAVSDLVAPALAEPPQLLDRRVEELARRQPDACALVSPHGRYSYRELAGAAAALARRMRSEGVGEGDRVALCLRRTPVQIAATLACWRLGAAAVFLDPAQPAGRLGQLLEDSDCALILSTSDAVPVGWAKERSDVPIKAAGHAALGLAPSLALARFAGAFGVQIGNPADLCPSYEKSDQLADHCPVMVLDHWPEGGSEEEESRSRAEAPAYLLYTSGSTGRPKGVLASHGGLAHYAAAISERLQLPAGARWGTLATVAADLGLTAVVSALCSGGTLVLPDPDWAFDPPALADYLAREPLDCLKIAPSHLKGLLAVAEPRRLLPRDTLVLGGEGLESALVKQLRALAPQLRIVNHYGPSEATVGVCCQPVDPAAQSAGPYLPLGTPLPGCRLLVLDGDGNPVPRGAAGELVIQGPQLALGYWRQPELTAAAFPPATDGGRSYRTGDRVRVNARGGLEFLGRLDDQVKIRGYRVEPGEAARWLGEQPEVAAAAVLAPALERGRQLVAYLQTEEKGFDLEALRARMRDQLPDYLVPAHWIPLERLPLNVNGKLDRSALPLPGIGQPRENREERPLSQTEAQLADIWRQLLPVERLGPDDDFFLLGGDSILSLRLIALAARAGLSLTPRQVAADGRLRAMAEDAELAGNTHIRQLRDLFRELLGRPDLGADDDFYKAGGDSILSLQLVARARELDIELTPRLLQAHPTPRALVAVLRPVESSDELDAKGLMPGAFCGTVCERDLADKPPGMDSPGGRLARVPQNAPGSRPASASSITRVTRVDREQPQPLSPTQRRLWFLQQLEPESAAYNVCQLLAIRGALDTQALRRAFGQLVDRHESLRCRFFEEGGQVWQRVAEQAQFSFRDHSAEKADWCEAAGRAAARPFDLERGPLLAVDLFQPVENDYRLLVNVHHIAVDGWSMGLLVGDFAEAYRAAAEGREADFPGRELEFLDLAVRQYRALDERGAGSLLDYWRARLDGTRFDLSLPLDKPRPARWEAAGRRLERTLPPERVREVDALARSLGVSPFTVCLVACQLLLWRYSGQADFTVGVPVAGRDDPRSQDLVGPFLNTLVHRCRLCPGQLLGDYLREVGQRHREDLEHQGLPFEQLVESLEVERDLSRQPLFQVAFNYQVDHRGERRIQLPGLTVEPLAPERVSAKFDLAFNLFEQRGEQGEGSTALLLEYPTALFREETVARMAEDYIELLGRLAAATASPLATLELPSATQPAAGEATPQSEIEDFVVRFDAAARRHPQRTAVISGERRLSYGELVERADQLAHWLLARGVAPEALVAFCLPRDERLAICLLGIQKAGAAYLPIDPAHPAERNGYILEQATPALLLCADQFSPLPQAGEGPGERALVGAVRPGAVRPGAAAGRDPRLAIPTITWSELEAQLPPVGAVGRPSVGRPSAGRPYAHGRDPRPAEPHHLAYTLYTSGSTGRPKGVQISRGNFANFLLAMERALPLEGVERFLALTTITFDIAGLEFCLPLARGGTAVIADDHQRRDPAALLALIRARDVQLVQATPATWSLLLEESVEALSGVVALAGGEALPADMATRLARAARAAFNVYGPTETTVWSTCCPVTEKQKTAVPIGRPLLNNRCHVLDAQLNPVPPGVAGELYIAGLGLARGYAGCPGLTAERFLPDPFAGDGGRLYRTGDRARWLPDGRLEYLGRTDSQVKVRGFRVELGEIEIALRRHPAVRQAAVALRSGELAAYWVNRDGCHVDAGTLRAHLAIHLPECMLPARYQTLETLPLNSNGKVDRAALPETGDEITGRVAAGPLTADQQLLAEIWREVLGVAELGADDNFFHLGGHSLSAAQVRSRLRARGLELPLKTFFERPVLARQAEALADAVRTEITPVRRGGDLPLSDAQRRVWFMQQLDPADASFNMAFAVELRGPVDNSALRNALEQVSARHEILRTTYHPTDGEPVQRIHDALPVDFAEIELPAGEGEAGLERRLSGEACRPFALEREAPLRVRLYRREERDFVCQFVQHHIASDAWSTALLLDEVIACYGGEELPPLAAQYVDYAAWQQSEARRAQYGEGLSFWSRTLAGMPPQLALPFDFPRPERDDGRGDGVDFQLGGAEWRALRDFARERQVSLFMLLLAALGLVLYRETRSRDLVIGTDVANREPAETESLIGFFVNLIALRLKPRPDAGFAGNLEEVRQVCLDAFAHQQVPFDRVVEAVGLPRQRNTHPLLQALLVMQNTPRQRRELPGIEVTPRPGAQHHSKFDMALFASETEEALQMRWVYRPSLFRRQTIERLRDRFCGLLSQALAAPDTPLSEFDLHPGGEESMASSAQKQRKLSKLGKLRRRPAAAAAPAAAPVESRPLREGQAFPLLVENRDPDLDPAAWAAANRERVEQWLGQHGGLLFRGFRLPTAVDFERFCRALYPELYGQYGDLPKKEVGERIYRSTPYPADRMILFHNESAHQHRWPRRQWFYCELPAAVGGATPIVDCRQLYQALPGWLRDKLQRKQLLYIRNFDGRIDVSWQHFFKTDSREAVETICREGGIRFHWGEGDSLHTRQRGPAVIRHPVTGELSFFNQIQLYHSAFLDDDVRGELLAAGGEERLPRHVCYGDGEPLEPEAIALISDAYERFAVRFDWRRGDVVMLDNMLAAHARDPFEGERRIAVAMGGLYRRDEVEAPLPDGEETWERKIKEEVQS
ncbi:MULTISPECIES: non-ribosomal peptide synthetase [unclassified Microbulbifer]|uniref:non-ribosomal peptide synthetase n=1 Tax=unclassified Microbulbifer TaxID=2619833 RepID=UPI0027E3B323|nr:MULTISPECIES: non-ribosomal peptide synthetase [unclassified Microbulbifer]